MYPVAVKGYYTYNSNWRLCILLQNYDEAFFPSARIFPPELAGNFCQALATPVFAGETSIFVYVRIEVGKAVTWLQVGGGGVAQSPATTQHTTR